MLRITLERYHPHANEPYDRSRQLIREQNTAHHNKVKGKAFKLNNHPADYFDHNPFKRVNINKPAEAEAQKVKLKAWFPPFQSESCKNMADIIWHQYGVRTNSVEP